MFRNYFIIAWRNLVKTKGYSLINIGGLSVGITIAMLFGLWLADELSFNKYHKNYDRIAQVMTKGNFNGQGYLLKHASTSRAGAEKKIWQQFQAPRHVTL